MTTTTTIAFAVGLSFATLEPAHHYRLTCAIERRNGVVMLQRDRDRYKRWHPLTGNKARQLIVQLADYYASLPRMAR